MRLYKGFAVYNDKYYINTININDINNYEFNKPYIIEKKSYNRKTYTTSEYSGNKTIYDAIDVYCEYKDKDYPKMPHSIIYDYWFDNLNRDSNLFHKTFGLNRIDAMFIDLEACKTYWRSFAEKDDKMNEFITNDLIKSFFNLYKESRLIGWAKKEMLDYLV